MTELRHPQQDTLAVSPIDWQDIPLGAGQENNNRAQIQFSKEGDALRYGDGSDIRRTPGHETAIVVHRPPQSPA